VHSVILPWLGVIPDNYQAYFLMYSTPTARGKIHGKTVEAGRKEY
jgi:hypothetical protein